MNPDFAFLDEAIDHCRGLCSTAADPGEAAFWVAMGKAAAAGHLDEWERLWHMRAAELAARDVIELASS